MWSLAKAGIFLILVGGQWCDVAASTEVEWVNHGNGLLNQRDAKGERKITNTSVTDFSLKWTFITGNDVTATPAISKGVIYFPSWNGNLYAVKQETGKLVWQKNLTQLTGSTSNIISRTTPTIYGNVLLVGIYGPANLLAINKSTGKLLWQILLDDHPYAVITMSGPAFQGFYYIGTSSIEEGATETCCSFQGAFFKVNINSGAVVWRVSMLPDNGGVKGGYSGAALWGSSPPIHVKRRAVYIATGNTYTTPPDVTACELAWQNLTNRPLPDPCLVYDNHQESILSIDIDSGVIKWATKLGGYDTWIVVCILVGPSHPNCPPIAGPDYDFGEAPMLLTLPASAGEKKATRDILVAGQKSGFVWALDAANGSVIWSTAAGPGGLLGGASWGMATDGERVFTNIINNGFLNFTLVPSNEVVTTGGWVALEATTGKVIWSVANPFPGITYPPVTHVNGVLLVGSTSKPGVVLALDAITGNILQTHTTNGSIGGGFSVSDGCGFVGVGLSANLRLIPEFQSGVSLNAYCVR